MKKDVLFLHSREKGWEERLDRVKKIFGEEDVIAVEGHTSILRSFQLCFETARTDMFIMIDGDNVVFDHAKMVLDPVDTPCVFMATNDYGVTYGHGGIKVLPKNFKMDEKFFSTYFLDISVHLDMKTRQEVLSHHDFRLSPYATWKALFRELLKLHLQAPNNEFVRIGFLREWLKNEEPRQVYAEIEEFCKTAKLTDFGRINEGDFMATKYAERFRVGLAAICRNESANVDRFIEQAKMFDFCTVIDTGSTDDTVAKLRAAGITVHEEAFETIDYAAFRNRAIERIEETERYDALLWLDFDEVLHGFDLLRLKKHLFVADEDTNSFSIARAERDGSYVSVIPRVFKKCAGRWHYAVHELFIEDEHKPIAQIDWMRIEHMAVPEERSKAKAVRYKDILRENLEHDPVYYLFYLLYQLHVECEHAELLDLCKRKRAAIAQMPAERRALLGLFALEARARSIKPLDFQMIEDILSAACNRSVVYRIINILSRAKQRKYPEMIGMLSAKLATLPPGDVFEACYTAAAYGPIVHAPLIQPYRGDFLERHADKIAGKRVLEVAANRGEITEHLVVLGPARLVMSDARAEHLTARASNLATVETAVLDILHDLPTYHSRNSFDTVVCGGYLHHCAHPLWAIEKMLSGRPQWLYIEAHLGGGGVIRDDSAHAAPYDGAMKVTATLTREEIEIAVSTVGYRLIDTVAREPINEGVDAFHPFWSRTTGLWFERVDQKP